jgi:hypothetical protein
MGSMIDLPSGDSSTLRLVHPTEEEKQIQFNLNGAQWRGALSLPAYLRREETLSQQPLTRDGGITYWALIDTALKGNPFDPASGTRLPLASCETYRKKALVWKDGELHESVCHGIGSVFCASHLRKRGYAQRMMRELCKALRTYQAEEGKENLFSVLYSDIGKVSMTKDTPLSNAHDCRNSTIRLAGSHSILLILPFQRTTPKAGLLFPLPARFTRRTWQSCARSMWPR